MGTRTWTLTGEGQAEPLSACGGRPAALLGLSSPYPPTTTPASGGRGDFSVHSLSAETWAAPTASRHQPPHTA